jgi:hypothetical protein
MARSARIAVVVLLAVVLGGIVVVRLTGDDETEPATTTTASTSTSTPTAITGQVGAPGIGDPYYPTLGNGGYDVAHYDLGLTWLGEGGRLDGVTTIDATATQDLSRFDLDL